MILTHLSRRADMTRLNISIPDDLKKRMESVNGVVQVNWSKIAVQAFEEVLSELEEHAGTIKKLGELGVKIR